LQTLTAIEGGNSTSSRRKTHSILAYHSFFGPIARNFATDEKDRSKNEYVDITYEKCIQSASAQADSSMKGVKMALAGNLIITGAKFASWKYSGSSAMLSEAIHSLVDSGNQALLLIGLRSARLSPDKSHQYGYGKAIYFWSLVSALGTFWLGAGVSLRNSIEDLFYPSVQLETLGMDVWGVLGLSICIDGYVFWKTLEVLRQSQPKGKTLWEHLCSVRDPTRLAILLEDGAACIGVTMAIAGIGLSKLTGSPVYDSTASVGISLLLAGMGTILARLNEKYLIGHSVEPEITKGINELLLAQPSITNISFVQSQWISPYTFAYKAEVDFDGTYLAARLLDRYEKEFRNADLEKDLNVLLAWYAEDVMRVVEQEVRRVEAHIREQYPAAAFIELEPDSRDGNDLAIDDTCGSDNRKKDLWQLEEETINQMIDEMNREVHESREAQRILNEKIKKRGG